MAVLVRKRFDKYTTKHLIFKVNMRKSGILCGYKSVWKECKSVGFWWRNVPPSPSEVLLVLLDFGRLRRTEKVWSD